MPDWSEEHARAKLVHNERTKLSATYLNGLAVAVFAVGGLAPLFSVLLSSSPAGLIAWLVPGLASICWLASVALHSAARRLLKDLVP